MKRRIQARARRQQGRRPGQAGRARLRGALHAAAGRARHHAARRCSTRWRGRTWSRPRARSTDATHDRVQVRVDGGLQQRQRRRRRDARSRAASCCAWPTSPTVRAGYEDPPTYHPPQRRAGAGHRRDDAGATATCWTSGSALEQRLAQMRQQLPVGVKIQQYADQPRVVAESVWEFERSFLEALAIVLAVSFLFLGWRTGIVVAASVPLVLGLVAAVMYAARLGAGPHLAGRTDHRAGPAGRRRHHRGGDDGGEAGAGLGPPARGHLRLHLHRVSDADRHAGHGRRLHAGGLREVDRRPVRGRHLLGRRAWRSSCRGSSPWCSRRTWACCCCRRTWRPARTTIVYDRPVYHRLRSVVDWAVQRRAGSLVAARCWPSPIAGAGMLTVQQQFFPHRVAAGAAGRAAAARRRVVRRHRARR